jgi:hypothetical protein
MAASIALLIILVGQLFLVSIRQVRDDQAAIARIPVAGKAG